jgi:hypothetical protein
MKKWGAEKPRDSSASAPAAAIGLSLGVLATASCGGGLPLLHPARTLPAGEVRAAAGFSGNVAVGGFSVALRNATNEVASNPSFSLSPQDTTFAKGALVAASVGPGLSPIAAARVGIGAFTEGGLTYTGRSIRGDVRRSFDLSPSWTLSVGVGGSAVLYGRQEGSSLPGVDLGRLHGFGADVPVLLGYQSDGELYVLWIGVRGGGEHVEISDLSSEPGGVTLGTPPLSLSATRFWAGGLLGVALGFRHIHVAMEMDVSYATIEGDFSQTHTQVAGLTLGPSTALWWNF